MQEPMVLKRIRPYYGRFAVVESDVDQEQRDSGLIVPIELEQGVRRGVIAHVDWIDGEEGLEYAKERVGEGSAVYFRGGVKISDMWFISSADIIAYEERD